MRSRFRIAAIAVSAALALLVQTNSASAESWKVPSPISAPSNGSWVVVNERGGFDLWSTRQSHPNKPNAIDVFSCLEGQTTDKCDFSNGQYRFEANQILPLCESSSQENCLEGITAVLADGTEVQGQFMHTVEGDRFKAQPETGLYSASMPSLFNIPGVSNSSGASTYAIALKGQMGFNVQTGKFFTRSISANIFGYSSVVGGFKPLSRFERVEADGSNKIYITHDPNCLFTETGMCGIEQDFPTGVAFKLSARIASEVAGWFHGRMTQQEISIERISSTNNRVSIKANPVDVARMAVVATRDNSSAEAQAMLLRRGGHGGYTAFNGNSIKDFWATEGDDAFFALNEWRDEMKDSAAGKSTEWNFATVENQQGNNCMGDKSRVLGMVTTNATLYSGDAPKFIGGELKYTVGGLHFAQDGQTLNEGTYDLVMRSDVARCLYGFTNAPISATVSVTGAGGETKTATTVVKETKDGWLKLAAYGFNFSSPTISVQLTQAKASAKKITITCVSVKNKKITKKISAIAPKCPTGYKKK